MKKAHLISIIVFAGLLVVGGLFILEDEVPAQIQNFNLERQDSTKIPSSQKIELLNVSARIFLIEDRNQTFSTNRDKQDVERIIREVNKIWSQGNIVLNVQTIGTAEIKSESWWTVDDFQLALHSLPQHNPSLINVYFVSTLGGSNGIASVENNIILVADYTTVNDYRATAHELGHILGLDHTSESQSRLMYRGANGTELIAAEIQTTRDHVKTDY